MPKVGQASESQSSPREDLQAPFPYFGGKSKIAGLVWDAFGDVRNYVEPFAGSLACLLARPTPFEGPETVNDACGFISNFWRATRDDPEAVAHHADWPVNENDLHARHVWLVERKGTLQARLEGDPDFYDPKVAGWWAWGICCWIGRDFCSGKGPWVSKVIDGARQLVKAGGDNGVNRSRIHLGNQGCGVNRQLIHLVNQGRGVNRKRDLVAWFAALAERLARVRVCCGDWSRVCGPSPTVVHGLTAVFLDPPYGDAAGRDMRLYRAESGTVAEECRRWALEVGDDPRLRIALCGYDGEHAMPRGWRCVAWKANGGCGSQGDADGKANRHRERVWFSPQCLEVGEDCLERTNLIHDLQRAGSAPPPKAPAVIVGRRT